MVQTPKVDVRLAIIKDNKSLLIQESIDNCWSLPRDWADYNLSAKENIAKEIKEEAGIIANLLKFIAVLDNVKHNKAPYPYGIYKIVTLCEAISGFFEVNSETAASGYFTLDKLPKLSTMRNTKVKIEMRFEASKEEDWTILLD